MSRSYKKPYFTDQQNGDTKRVKRRANRAIRNMRPEEAPADGKAYRKEFESWAIRDWSIHCPENKKAKRK